MSDESGSNGGRSAGLLGRIALVATAFFGALTALAGCEDASVVTRTSREVALSKGAVQALAAGGLPTEIHGLPWPDATEAEVADQLRLPNGFPKGARFRLVRPKADLNHRDRRLVLIFNDGRPPDEWAACDATRNMAGFDPKFRDGKGFQVFAVFCDGTESIGRGHMDARGVAHGDWPAFQNEMRRLFRLIVADFTGEDK